MTIEDANDNEIIVIFHFLKAYYTKYPENTYFKTIFGLCTKIITIKQLCYAYIWTETYTRDNKKGLESYLKQFWVPYDTLRPFPQSLV